jgi:ATP-binding cassette, subfamily B, bacterial PglK
MIISVKKMWSILSHKDRIYALVLFVFMLIGMILEMLGIGLVIPLITVLMQEDLAIKYPVVQSLLNYFGNPNQATLITYSMIVLVGVYMIKNLFLAFLVWKQRYFSYRVRTDLGHRLFSNYLYQPYAFHLQHNSAQLIRNVSGEVSILISYGINSVLIIATEALIILGILGMLIAIEPAGALIIIITVGSFSLLFYWLLRSKVASWGKERQYHDGMLIQHLQQGLGGVKDTKVIGCEDSFVDGYDFHNKKSSKIAQWEQTLQALPRLWIELIAIIGLVILVVSLNQGAGKDVSNILPVLGLFAAAAFRLMPSLSRVISSLHAFQFSQPVIDILEKEIKLEREVQAVQMLNQPGKFDGKIELKNIDFSYPASKKKILHDISIIINHNESVGFIGKSGSGKSTIVDIILGLLSPDSGEVIVDGSNIQDDINRWRGKIGYVPQSVFLTDGSLKSNVAFGLREEDINENAVWSAIKSAQLEEFVANQSEGLEAIIGERGVRLSGGQRQRIGIARALYHSPPVLVLDEATSSLDVKTERDFMKTIDTLHGERTLIIIAHRLSTIEHCDRVYRLEDGHIVDNEL